jgi:hypothetical protein
MIDTAFFTLPLLRFIEVALAAIEGVKIGFSWPLAMPELLMIPGMIGLLVEDDPAPKMWGFS